MAGARFGNPWPHPDQGSGSIFKWKFGIGPQEHALIPGAGEEPPPWHPLAADLIARPPGQGWRVTWLGHASFLLQGAGLSILIDPVFSDYCSPIPIRALKRKVPPPCKIPDLPTIDVVLLTHGHYDHLDLPTLRALPGKPRFITAEGHSRWLTKKTGRAAEELSWHESLELTGGIRVTATPAQHFTARTPFDRNRAHWCGWIVEGADCKIWHAGDTGYGPFFREIGGQYGPFDLGLIPIGAYQPRSIMKPIHMNPEEAVLAFIEARCHRALGMHWGTFALTDEPLHEPPLRLRREIARRGLPEDCFTAGEIGLPVTLLPEG